jgi:tRNA-splicing ligase RtcB
MPIQTVLNEKGPGVPVKIWSTNVESQALDQLKNIAKLPFVFKQVSVMPDVHLGVGATVGSVVATKGAVCPAAVGVDIGCGMAALKLKGMNKKSIESLDLAKLRHSIERSIPVGFESNKNISAYARNWKGWDSWGNLHPKCQNLSGRALSQLGSLGGGNHFIELCLDENDDLWIMLHSGSRNIGKSLAEEHISTAKGLMKQMFISLPDKDLAYFVEGTSDYVNYIRDLTWAQDYARANREIMLQRVLRDVSHWLGYPDGVGVEFQVNCHHNFAAMEHHFGENVLVTRKGAVRARQDDFGIIPGSMGTKSYIVRGLGNPDSFNSCSHGAGRRMSRGKAKANFTLDDLREQTRGVECRKDADVLDEIPGAYKDIDEVMANQSDLVTVLHTLKQILCVKG